MPHRHFFPFDDPDYRRPLHEVVYRGMRIRVRPYSVALRWRLCHLLHRLHGWWFTPQPTRDGRR